MRSLFLLSLSALLLRVRLVSSEIAVEYYTNSPWNFYTRGFKPWHIDFTKVNHVIYGYFKFADDCSIQTTTDNSVLDFDLVLPEIGMGYADDDGPKGAVGAFKRLQEWAADKGHPFKLIASIGGSADRDSAGSEPRSSYYRRCTKNEGQNLFHVANNVRDFISEHGFDGVHLDWQFPENAGDYAQLRAFTNVLRDALTAGAIISLEQGMMPEDIDYVDATIIGYLDFVVLHAYDYHKHWIKDSNKTGIHAPLSIKDDNPEHNIEYGVEALILKRIIENGVETVIGKFPPNKMVLGITAQGQCWHTNAAEGRHAAIEGKCQGTHVPGEVHYATIVEDYDGFLDWDEDSFTPYAFKNVETGVNSFVTYDDEESINLKILYAKDAVGLAGFALFEVAGDREISPLDEELPNGLGYVRSYELLNAAFQGWNGTGSSSTSTATVLRTTTSTSTEGTTPTDGTTITTTPTDDYTTTTTTKVTTTTKTWDHGGLGLDGIMDRLMKAYFERFDARSYFETYMNWFMDKLEEVTWDNTTTEDTTVETDTTRTGETTSSTEEDPVTP